MALRFDEIQAINIENFSGTTILEVTQPTYTILRNPEGSRTLYMGDSADRGNYYDNDFHRFRYAGGQTTQMIINGSGKVGIANTSPGARLHVTGNSTGGSTSSLILEASDGSDRFNFRDDGTMTWGPTSQMGKLSWDTNEAMVFGQSGKALNLGSNGTVNRLFIATNGRVGIGTDSPSYGLDVAINPGSGGVTTRLTQGNYRVKLNGVDLLGYASDKLWMISNSTSPSIVVGQNWDWDLSAEFQYVPGTAAAGGGVLSIGQLEKNSANWTHGHTRFKVGGSDRVAITTTGLGVGTNSPSYKLHVSGTSYFSDRLMVKTTNTNSNKNDFAVGTGGDPQISLYSNQVQIGGTDMNWQSKWYYASGTAYLATWDGHLDFFTAGGSGASAKAITFRPQTSGGAATERMRIHTNGYVGIGTTSPYATLHVGGTYILNGQKGLTVRSIDDTNYYTFNDNSTTADFQQQFPQTGGSGTVAKVDDSTAPAVGCFEITGNYYADGGGSVELTKVDINAEYTWEMYIKYVSGSDTAQGLYMGWTMYNASKSSFGNTQRYWGAANVQVDANSNNSDWVLVRGTISGVGSNTGNFISGTEYVKPVILTNYNDNTNVIRVCGIRLYKSSKNATKIQLGRSGASSVATLNVNTEYPQYRVTLENTNSDGLRVRNDHGYIEIGSLNSGHAHIQTDRSNFYFNKRILVNEGIVSSYDENLTLQTSQSTRMTIVNGTGNVGIATTSPSDGDLNINDPRLHVVGPSTASAFNLVARFEGGNDSDNTGAAIAINHSNDRGLLIRAGRKDSDRPVAYFDLIDSNGSRTNMMTLGEFGSNFRVDIDPFNQLNASSPSPVPNSIARVGGSLTIQSGKYISLDDDYYNHAHMRYNGSGGEARFELLGYYGIDFKTRSTTKMVIKGDNGFVGIGTTSPGTKLHVSDGEIRISNSYGTKDIAQFYNTMTFKGDSNCQFYFGTSQNPSYSTPLPVHTGKLNVTGHIYGGAAVQTITTTSGTINLDAEDYGVFRLTSSLTGTTTLNIQNMKSGQVIDVVLTGDQTVNLTSDDTAETFYRIGETTYDGTATNHLQIVCISDANSAAIYHFTVAKIASSSSI